MCLSPQHLTWVPGRKRLQDNRVNVNSNYLCFLKDVSSNFNLVSAYIIKQMSSKSLTQSITKCTKFSFFVFQNGISDLLIVFTKLISRLKVGRKFSFEALHVKDPRGL